MSREAQQTTGGQTMKDETKSKQQTTSQFRKDQKEAPFIGQHDDQEKFFHFTFGC